MHKEKMKVRRPSNCWLGIKFILAKNDKPASEWVELIRDYPDRFVLGSDLVGHFDSMKRLMDDYQPLLDALPQKVAEQLASGNAAALVPEKGAQYRRD